ncbi:MAG TPA: hypothetical protein VJQ52_03580 [Steroidobacteraceae bacterium]|nr:hypothetical protein [Steroidobacteraceae bacterium]
MLSNILRVGSACIASLLLVACGSAKEPPKPPPVEETVFRDDVAAMQKAREVEDMVMQQKAAQDRAIEQAERAQ